MRERSDARCSDPERNDRGADRARTRRYRGIEVVRESTEAVDLATAAIQAFARLGQATLDLGRWVRNLVQEHLRAGDVALAHFEFDEGRETTIESRARRSIGGIRSEALTESEARLGTEPVGTREIDGHRTAWTLLQHDFEFIDSLARRDTQRQGAPVPQEIEDLHSERLRIRRALAGLARSCAIAQRRQLRGHRCRIRNGLGLECATEHAHDRIAYMTRLSGKYFVQRCTEQVHIRSCIDCVTDHHLRCHVGGRSDDCSGLRRCFVAREGNTPVDQVDLAEVPDHHVLGLDVAMDHATRVRELHSLTNLHENPEVRLEPIATASRPSAMLQVAQQCPPVDPLDTLHHENRTACIVDAERVYRDHAGVFERAGDPCFAQQRRGRRWLDRFLDRLHRDFTIERSLPREQHPAHTALADDLDD